LLILQQSKNFSHQAYGDKKCLIANLVTIENFKSPSDTPPPSNGNSNFLVVQESKGWDPFFSRMILHTPPPFLGTENFQSPFDIPQLLDDHQKTLVVERARASTIILGEKKIILAFPIGQPKNFNCHSIVVVGQMATRIFWSFQKWDKGWQPKSSIAI